MSHFSISKWSDEVEDWVDPHLVHQQYLVTGKDNDVWDETYRFSDFALCLNQTSPDLEKLLPPTDSRFRPDNRCMERGESEES